MYHRLIRKEASSRHFSSAALFLNSRRWLAPLRAKRWEGMLCTGPTPLLVHAASRGRGSSAVCVRL
ncbi:hypothetical protein BKA80DRAFT_259290 [Phyllosticta citrichinensis]